ncbi:hypothetical protein LWI28_002904 [Acer negundo]|uniref:Uncharacterized protein n=1 Tax=Acer negundo TaxID=4023 RepID=A0AAD5JHW0_ACENE|nr:hypothetical protein LWI28_002904 [Acer negundo]
MGRFKSSGPGGQHRNKRESGVRLKHKPSGIISQISTLESCFCSLFSNSMVHNRGSDCGPQIGPNNPKFALGMQALLDLIFALEGSISQTAQLLG